LRLRVLIVEDEALIAQEIEAALADAGFAIVGLAPTVSKALALIAEAELEAVVLDANLRGHSAEPVALVLREAGIPFIVLTGYGKAHLTGPLLDAPRLAKPFHPETLVRTVRDVARIPG
jgi:DNA-binding response OmpR family regulator